MAQRKSTAITNLEAKPQVTNPSYKEKAPLFVAKETVEIAAADADGDTHLLLALPSNCIVDNLAVANDAIAGATAYEIGVFDSTGTVKDADAFGSAVDFSSARAQFTELTHESAAHPIEDLTKKLWQVAGYTSDPGGILYIGLTLTTAGTAAGTVCLRVYWHEGH